MEADRTAAALGGLVDRLVDAANRDARVKALWLEGPSPESVRRPYAALDIHLAVDEPDYDAVLAGLEGMVGDGRRIDGLAWADVPRFARQMSFRFEGTPVAVVLEKTPLLPKRPRAAVACLLDRTGHLYHVMDFSKPRG
jgi:hypothetical protein